MTTSAMFRRIFTKEGFVLLSVPLSGGYMWIMHFILEFATLSKLVGTTSFSGSLFLILFHLALVPVGCAYYVAVSSRWSPFKAFGSGLVVLASVLIGLILLPLAPQSDPSLALANPVIPFFAILLAVGGFGNGTFLAPIMLTSYPFFDNPEYNGRFYFTATAFLGPIVIFGTIFAGLQQVLDFIVYVLLLLTVILVSLYVGRDQLEKHPPRCTNIRAFFRQPNIWPSILIMFFVGFFFTNTYFASVILLNASNLLDSLSTFVIVLFGVSILATIPSGYLFDKLGRRWSLLIGFYLQAIAFLLLSFFATSFVLQTLFPAIIAIGFTISIFGAFLYSLELMPRGFTRVHQGISWAIFGVGMSVGVITDLLLYSLITTSPAYLPLVLIFALFTATIVLLQTKETLPSREELEWRKKVEHILVLSKGGLPLYSEKLGSTPTPESGPDEMLVGGALTGISELVKEISQRAAKLKVIQQEGFCILLEEGRDVIVALMAQEELDVIRSKLQDFLEEFQRFFGELAAEWTGDPKVFSPTRQLVARHFDL